MIPDFMTWAQYFAVYTAALTLKHPERLLILMVYLSETAKNAKKFKWPSWVIYDQNYVSARDGNQGRDQLGGY